MRRQGQVDGQRRRDLGRRGRLLAALEGLQALDGVGEEAGVEVEADGPDMPALLRAQEVAGAPYLQVAQGDLEARPQLRRLEDGLEALLGGLAQRTGAVGGAGGGGAAVHA